MICLKNGCIQWHDLTHVTQFVNETTSPFFVLLWPFFKTATQKCFQTIFVWKHSVIKWNFDKFKWTLFLALNVQTQKGPFFDHLIKKLKTQEALEILCGGLKDVFRSPPSFSTTAFFKYISGARNAFPNLQHTCP